MKDWQQEIVAEIGGLFCSILVTDATKSATWREFEVRLVVYRLESGLF